MGISGWGHNHAELTFHKALYSSDISSIISISKKIHSSQFADIEFEASFQAARELSMALISLPESARLTRILITGKELANPERHYVRGGGPLVSAAG